MNANIWLISSVFLAANTSMNIMVDWRGLTITTFEVQFGVVRQDIERKKGGNG